VALAVANIEHLMRRRVVCSFWGWSWVSRQATMHCKNERVLAEERKRHDDQVPPPTPRRIVSQGVMTGIVSYLATN